MLSEPALLVGHAAGYAALIGQETATWQARMKRRLAWWVLLTACGWLVLLLSGIALMLYAVTGTAHWLLWGVPALPLLGVLVAATCLTRENAAPPTFPRVQAQLDKDMQLFGLKDADR
ncbi:MAG: hypothetical protein GZ085_01230 [Sulfuriferula multivorans]|uniref:Phage holin family protein n=1 Tax=Sulfuriferula multivorans TaxID=1559896 RepID=A0A7C9K8S6_9PROT|nr:hypothetical protein [Sulfuriferula multivorans]